MKKIACLLLIVLLLSGCSRPAWETVEDEMPEVPAAQWLDETYTIEIGVPADTELLESKEDWKVYSTQNGEFEVETRKFLASGLGDAVKTLTGYSQEQLTIMETSRFDLPEYQFVWVTQTQQGSRLCRADLVMDGADCYAVVCSTLEQVGTAYEPQVRQAISTFGLFMDEGV